MSTRRRTFLKQIGFGAAGLSLASTLPDCLAAGQLVKYRLPRSTPEAQGVSSQGILEFLDALAKSEHEFHSFMMVRHGRVIAEGWWSPYQPDLTHMLYSLSKSFTSTAIGLAVTEGRLTVHDPVLSFFPDQKPDTVSENLAALQVKHLLTMSVGHAEDSTPKITKEENWAKAFLALPMLSNPMTASLFPRAAEIYRLGRWRGVTIRSSVDCLIAAVAIENRVSVWHRDRDFSASPHTPDCRKYATSPNVIRILHSDLPPIQASCYPEP